MDQAERKDVIDWRDGHGHTEHEILDPLRGIVGAKPRPEDNAEKTA